jgi:hypothetical protein
MQFVTKTSSLTDLHVMYKNKEIANTSNTKFLSLTLDNTFSWKNHRNTIAAKLSSACFAVSAIKPFLSQESLRMVYFSYFHSIMTYGLVFWGYSYHSRKYFRRLKILPLQSQYIYLLSSFVINNRQHFKINYDIPLLWSHGQSSWLQIRRPGFDSRHYQKKSNGSGTGSTQPREYN